MYVKQAKDACSGCGLCVSVCPKNSIIMTLDNDGFMYPNINEKSCIKCGKCKKICPFHKKQDIRNDVVLESLAIKHNDEVRSQSASGGFFTALSDYILSNKGVVYGAVWNEDFSVSHIRAEDTSNRNRMRSSKYIQSDMSSVYKTIKQDVGSGRPVLFTGTPCQCAAVDNLFGNVKPKNLYYMDLICHGVLSHKFLNEYIENVVSTNAGKQVKSLNLRDKKYGWQSVGIEFEDGTFYQNEKDYFYKVYGMNALQRPACFSCVFGHSKRLGDFTVGDFHGIKNHYSDFYDDLGVSLVLINTEKGNTIYKQIASELQSISVKENEYRPYQPNLSGPTVRGRRASAFAKYYYKFGYKKTMHRYFEVTLMRRINRIGYKIYKKIAR